jgi:hypothetical protein
MVKFFIGWMSLAGGRRRHGIKGKLKKNESAVHRKSDQEKNMHLDPTTNIG